MAFLGDYRGLHQWVTSFGHHHCDHSQPPQENPLSHVPLLRPWRLL